MQVAKGPYKCVLRQLRMTCELRSCPRTPVWPKSAVRDTRTERALPAGVTRVAERLRGSPRTRPRQPRGAFRCAAVGANYGLTAYQRPLAGSAC